jgi:hypothetical protein
MNEINMVPFIDVMLVLLIIFMVTAPLITPSLIDLPSVGKASRKPDKVVEVLVGKDETLELKTATRPVHALKDIAPAVLQAQSGSRRQRRRGDQRRPQREVRDRGEGDGHAAARRRAARRPCRCSWHLTPLQSGFFGHAADASERLASRRRSSLAWCALRAGHHRPPAAAAGVDARPAVETRDPGRRGRSGALVRVPQQAAPREVVPPLPPAAPVVKAPPQRNRSAVKAPDRRSSATPTSRSNASSKSARRRREAGGERALERSCRRRRTRRARKLEARKKRVRGNRAAQGRSESREGGRKPKRPGWRRPRKRSSGGGSEAARGHLISASSYRRDNRRRTQMRFKNKELLLGVLLGAGLNLLNSLRERLPDNLGRHQNKSHGHVWHSVQPGEPRQRRASRSRGFAYTRQVGALLIGVGVGVGVGLLIAPASGEETRTGISDKVSDFGEKVREQVAKRPQSATGTHGE